MSAKSGETVEAYKTYAALVSVLMVFFFLAGARWILGLALGMLVIAALSETAVARVHEVWTVASSFVGGAVTKVCLFLFYFIIFTPLALLTRAFRPRMRQEFFGTTGTSAFVELSGRQNSEHFAQLW